MGRRPDNPFDSNFLEVRVVRVLAYRSCWVMTHLAAEVAARLFQRLACAGGQPFHDVTFTAMKCTCSMYIVENGRQKRFCKYRALVGIHFESANEG